MNFERMYSELQILLKKEGHYDGPIDGKVGPMTLDAIALLIQSYGISTKGWNKTKLKIAGEQALYKSMKIDVGRINGGVDIDGVDDQVLGYARDVYEAKNTINFRDNVEALAKANAAIVAPTPVKVSPKLIPSDLSDINTSQLAFIRGIGMTETGFSKAEAYTDKYNKESNNSNVRKYGEVGADYGYYQTNGLDVKEAIKLGVDPEIAKHLNGGGKNGTSTIAEQTRAMHEYISRKYSSVYTDLKSDKPTRFDTALEAMKNHWFGLKDRPDVAKKEFAKWKLTAEKIFPNETLPVVSFPVSTSTKWPLQKDCTSFYGKVGTNQDMAVMPYEMVIAWEPKTKIRKFSVHRLVKAPVERIFQRTLDYYGYEKIKELGLHLWGGALNVRKIRGGSGYSMHSWGIAVDMDPDNNQLKWGRDQATFAKPIYNKYWEFVYAEGAISLGKERNYDWMHFQFARL